MTRYAIRRRTGQLKAARWGGTEVFANRRYIPTALVDNATPAGVQPVGQTGYNLLMSEEFTGALTVTNAALGYVKFRADGPQWATWYPDWPRFNAQSPGGNHTNTNVDGYYATSKVSSAGGALTLRCDRETTVPGLNYTAGMIQSLPSFQFRYGYAEARIKVSSRTSGGAWPAWWMHNANFDLWPPEIDIFEYYGNNFGTDQVLNNTFGDGNSVIDTNQNAAPVTSWHVYGCKWSSTQVLFYLDGVLTTTIARNLTTDMFLILDNAADVGSNPTFSSFEMDVDYVRVWQ